MNTLGTSRSGDRFVRQMEMPFHRDAVETIQTEVCAELAQRGYGREAVFAVRLSIEEAIMNAYRHGNAGDADKKVRFECEIDDESISMEVTDEGMGFELNTVPDPTKDENLEVPSGRGILLMREYMTEVEYVHPGNRVRMAYRRTVIK